MSETESLFGGPSESGRSPCFAPCGDAVCHDLGCRYSSHPVGKVYARDLFFHNVQVDVTAFHRELDIPVGDSPAIRRPELRAALIEEEASETCAAIRAGNLMEAIDGMCDVLCVIYGAAVEFGVNLAPFWDEVHRTNMAKVGGPLREDGKRLKPAGWTPPDIAGILERQQ